METAPCGPWLAQLQLDQPDPQPPVKAGAQLAGQVCRQLLAAFQPAAAVPRRQGYPAQDGHVHPADHQHVGKPRRPVRAVQLGGDAGAVPHDHGGQSAGLVAVQRLAQRRAEPHLQPGRPGPETAARPHAPEPPLVLRQQGHPIGVAAGPVCLRGGFQAEPALDRFPRLAQGQAVALTAEGRGLPVRRLDPQPRADGGAGVALLDVLHRGGQPHRPAVVPFRQGAELCAGAHRKAQAQRCAQQQPEAIAAGPAARCQHQARKTKKSRKGPKARLRLKSSDQLRAQRTGEQRADRPPHPISGRTGAAAPGR